MGHKRYINLNMITIKDTSNIYTIVDKVELLQVKTDDMKILVKNFKLSKNRYIKNIFSHELHHIRVERVELQTLSDFLKYLDIDIQEFEEHIARN